MQQIQGMLKNKPHFSNVTFVAQEIIIEHYMRWEKIMATVFMSVILFMHLQKNLLFSFIGACDKVVCIEN